MFLLQINFREWARKDSDNSSRMQLLDDSPLFYLLLWWSRKDKYVSSQKTSTPFKLRKTCTPSAGWMYWWFNACMWKTYQSQCHTCYLTDKEHHITLQKKKKKLCFPEYQYIALPKYVTNVHFLWDSILFLLSTHTSFSNIEKFACPLDCLLKN